MEEKDNILDSVSSYLYSNPIIKFIQHMKHFTSAKILAGEDDKTILDLGSGKGNHFPYVQSKRFLGLDKDENSLMVAKRNFPDARLLRSDISCMPFKTDSIDNIVSLSVLEHLPNLEECIAEIKRVLKIGEEFVISIPTGGFLFSIGRALTVKKYIERKYLIDYEELCEEEHVNTYEDIVSLLKKHFTVLRMVGIPFIVPSIFLNAFMIIHLRNKQTN